MMTKKKMRVREDITKELIISMPVLWRKKRMGCYQTMEV